MISFFGEFTIYDVLINIIRPEIFADFELEVKIIFLPMHLRESRVLRNFLWAVRRTNFEHPILKFYPSKY